MNILVIGNGFDLAHGLLTKYTDFLDFVKVIKRIYFANYHDICAEEAWQKLNIRNSTNKESLKEFFINIYNTREVEEFKPPQDVLSYIVKTNIFCDEFHRNIVNDIWVDYFLQCNMYQKENWIDFESEISNVIQSLDQNMGHGNFNSNIILLSNKFFNNKYTNNVPEYLQATAEEQEKIKKPEITYQELRDILLKGLDKLIRALEIYLARYVEEIEISKISKDIKELDIDHVLSFNYTDTFEKLYGENNNIEYDYIHGKADNNNTIVTNNMVLGIDEYLSKKEEIRILSLLHLRNIIREYINRLDVSIGNGQIK